MKITQGNKSIDINFSLEKDKCSKHDILMEFEYGNKTTKVFKKDNIIISKRFLNDLCFDIRAVLFGSLREALYEDSFSTIKVITAMEKYTFSINLKKYRISLIQTLDWEQLNQIYHEMIEYFKNRITCGIEVFVEKNNPIIFKNDKYEVECKLRFETTNVSYDYTSRKFITYLTKNNMHKAYLIFDEEGNLLNNYHIDYLREFHDGVAVFGVNGKGMGYLDLNFNIIVDPIYENCTDFKDGISLVKTYRKNRFFVDTSGKLIEGTDFLCTDIYKHVEEFSDDMCRVSLMNEDLNLEYWNEAYGVAGLWGYMNTEGKIVIPPQYIFANDFENGLAVVAKGNWIKKPNGKFWMDKELWGVIDKEGKEVIPCIYEEIEILDMEKYKYFLVRQNGLFGVMDNTGKMLVEPKFFGFGYEYEGNLLAYYDEYEFNEITGRYYDAKIGVYDFINNKIVFKPQFLDIELLQNNLMIVEYFDEESNGSLYSVVDVEGKVYLKDLKYIRYIKDKYFLFKTDIKAKGYGLVDLNGNVIVEQSKYVKYINNWECEKEIYVYFENDKRGVKSFNGDIIIPALYDDIDVAPGVIFVKQNDKCGMLSLEGDILVPCEYDQYTYTVKSNYFIFFKGNESYVFHLKKNIIYNMTLLEKVEYIRSFVNKHLGYPLTWLEVTPKVEILNKAVEIIQNNPSLSLKEFIESMNIVA